MTKQEILLKRLRCEANFDCPYQDGCAEVGCSYALPDDLSDYDPRVIAGEAADEIERLMSLPTSVGVPLTPSQCKNLAEFIELFLLLAIRDDEDIDNIEWVRSMLDSHKELMEASGKRWNDDKEYWEGFE